MEDWWLSQAKRLQAIASTGLHFAENDYDRERFEEVAGIANQMIAQLGNVPLNRIQNLISDFAKGYATPKIDVRGAVMDKDRILLVQEKSDGRWALPGGFADVGLSGAENIEKEVREEAGLVVAATRLYGVRHKAKLPYDPDARDFYKLFFICEQTEQRAPSPGSEISGTGFFSVDKLPELSKGRTIEADIHNAFAFRANPAPQTMFD